MIVGAIIGIIELVAKTIVKLLLIFGLWVPLLYSVIFLLICVASGTDLASVSGIYITGLLIALLGSVYVISLRLKKSPPIEKKLQTGANEKPIVNMTKNTKGREKIAPKPTAPLAAPQATPYGQMGSTDPDTMMPSVSSIYGSPVGFASILPRTDSATSPTAMPPAMPTQPPTAMPPQTPPVNVNELLRELRPHFQQPPLVFASRKDPDVFVYEYTDRVEFYRRTMEGMLHIDTIIKPKKNW